MNVSKRTLKGLDLGDSAKVLEKKMRVFGAELGFPPRGGNPFSSRLKPAENGARFAFFASSLNRFEQVWTSLDRFGQVWTSLDTFGQVWTGLQNFFWEFNRYLRQDWTSLDKFRRVWTSLDKFGRV